MEYMDLKSLLNFGLPNMPRTVIGLRKKAQRDGWQTRRRQGKGGGVEYALPAPSQTGDGDVGSGTG